MEKGKIILIFGKVAVVVMTLYCFFEPTKLTFGGYALAIDGAVISRTMCLLCALFYIVSILEDLCS